MERLTKRNENGNPRCGAFRCMELECSAACEYYWEMIEKLAHYEDLEEQGKLIVLPCTEGDLIYLIENNTDACDECDHFQEGCYEVGDWCGKVKGLPDFPQYSRKPLCDKQYFEIVETRHDIDWIFNNRKCFKKTWFLDKKEARKVLAEMEK